MSAITLLHADIDERVKAIRETQPDWLCRQGCDGCCRRLAEVPIIAAEEWRLLRAGLSALPPEQLAAIKLKVTAMADQLPRHIVCPMLDQTAGACQVYAHRPVACRTYGFYVQHNQGLYCKDIESQVDSGALAVVVWGNHDVIDRRLGELGDARELTEWFASW